jgi:hypothetical protein
MLTRIKAFFSHSRTIFVARLYTLAGVLVAAMPWVMGQDWTPVFNFVFAHVPDAIRPMIISAAVGVFLSVSGELFAWLRSISPGYKGTPLPDAQLDEVSKKGTP